MDELHSLLSRQLKRTLGDPHHLPEELAPFVAAVNDAYRQSDADRTMLERSLDLSSQELMAANREMRAVVRLLPDLFFRLSRAGVVLDCNADTQTLLDLPQKDLIGRRLQDVPMGEAGPLFADALERAGRSNDRVVIEYGLPTARGARYHEATLLPLRAGEVIVFVRDITSRRLAEDALRESERKYRELADSLPETVFEMDAEGHLTFVNRQAHAVFGITAEDVQRRMAAEEFVVPEQREQARDHLRRVLQGERLEIELVAQRRDGSTFPVTARTRAVVENGRPVGLRGVLVDLSERKRAEHALREKERQQRALLDNLPDIAWLKESTGLYIAVNEAFVRAAGRPREALIGLSDRDVWPPDQASVLAGFDHQVMNRREQVKDVVVIQDPAGHETWLETVVTPVLGADGRVEGTAGIARDITERIQAEAERSRLAAAVEQAAEAILITDTQGLVRYVNPAFERITGFARAEIMGQNPRLLKSGAQGPEFYRDLWATITRGQVWHGRVTDRCKDGSLVEFETSISPIRDRHGKLVNFVSVSHDVSREIALEEKLRQSQKMEAIGRLAGGIAHDFNNLLTAILGNAELALRQIDAKSPVREDVEEIRRAASRAAQLTGQLLAFSRKQVLHPKTLNLNQVVGEMTRMLQRVIGEQVQLITELAPDLRPIKADPVQMEQVIMNLALNARDAMPEGGRLHIITANAQVDEAHAARYADVPPGRYAALTVSDTGIGMSAETQAHLFEPFFTTKEMGKGTGLGLATIYGIIKQSGGHISVYSEPRIGTTFNIYLPLSREALTDEVVAPVSPPRQAGEETILVVEDEAPIRKLTARILEQAGYRVLDARDAREALETSRHWPQKIDLVLTDVVMPGMNGQEMAEVLRRERPGSRILFMSGHPETSVLRLESLQGEPAFIRKPFTGEQLTRKIRETLEKS
jgi:two-component system cell cycle sensor histidine kinase/response regulator CckA